MKNEGLGGSGDRDRSQTHIGFFGIGSRKIVGVDLHDLNVGASDRDIKGPSRGDL